MESLRDELIREVLASVPRLLSLEDRNPASPTYGCFDRDYWHYQLAADFPGATWQSAVVTLAHVFVWDRPENPYHHDDSLKEWIRAGLLYWTTIQHTDGSFDEWYPHEHSHVGTAFTVYAVAETLRLIPELLDDRLRIALRRAAVWLERHHDFVVCNHAAGAVAALHGIGEILGEARFLRSADEECRLLSERMSGEGWLPEYGGADAGYTSVSLDYLAAYAASSGNTTAQLMADRLANFLEWMVFPDGSSGGFVGSRNTTYLFPRGLILASSHSESARRILFRWHKALKEDRAVTPATMDDRYSLFFLLPNWCFAAESLIEGRPMPPPEGDPKKGVHYFPEAGLLTGRGERHQWIINLAENGVATAYLDGKRFFADAGYSLTLESGGAAVSQNRGLGKREILCSPDSRLETVILTAPLAYKKEGHLFASFGIPFRLATRLLSVLPFLALPFSRLVKKAGITAKRSVPVTLKRTIVVQDEGRRLVIEDELRRSRFVRVKKLRLPAFASWLHVPSSRYFTPAELGTASYADEARLTQAFKRSRRIRHRVELDFAAGERNATLL